MVQNTLGHLWLDSHPDPSLKKTWEYYLENEEIEVNAATKSEHKKDEYKNIKPEEIKIIDPCMGSGHILVYAFDVLMQIYESYGYRQKDAAKLILQKNLYGLDIDGRAYQLAYFAVMMRARKFNKNILKEGITLNICLIEESNAINSEIIRFLSNGEKDIERDAEYVKNIFIDAKYYGSILDVKQINFDNLNKRVEEIKKTVYDNLLDIMYQNEVIHKFIPLLRQAQIMVDKFDVVCTNPPYINSKYMPKKLRDFLETKYSDYKNDLFSAFIIKCGDMCRINGHIGMITPYVWMFINSYEKLRKKIINTKTISSLIQLEYNSFDAACVPVCTFTMRNYRYNIAGEYIKLSNFKGIDLQAPKTLEAVRNHACGYRYSAQQESFSKIPGTPIAYWVNENFREIYYKSKTLGFYASPRQGLATADNDKFLRYWHEVNNYKIGFSYKNAAEALESKKKWFPYNKGGKYRKWFGNSEYLVNWENDGYEIKNFRDSSGKLRSRPQNIEYYFKEGITWSFVSSAYFGARYSKAGFLFDIGGSSVFPKLNHIYFLTALLCSKLSFEFLKVQNPTLNFQVGNIANIPVIFPDDKTVFEKINNISLNSIDISKIDWDSFETSWDFKMHPILQCKSNAKLISLAFDNWSKFAANKFNQLKASEEELNRIFIDIYGLKGELTPEVADEDITVSKADEERDIKSFISYAVGCMFGRYSLDEEGLVFAGGEFDNERYKNFTPDNDNVLVITEEDYFEDDIANRFVEFVKVSFGAETLEENLNYIANVLSPNAKDTARNVIRKYFIKDFYKDHVKTYKKRPIYWMLDSGKGNAFKALFYLHRYDKSTIARIRTEYLHRLQKMYENDIEITKNSSASGDTKSKKRIESLNKKIAELQEYDKVVAHIAYKQIELDLDDGVDVNYEKFQEVEIPQGEGRKPLKANLLAKR